jgi:uncharacterized protein (TIGR02996 family)
MFTEESLLRAILEDPGDDDPRLAYADWLDEHGDPDRADFIRVQIRRARLAEGDSQQRALAATEQQLLQAHGDVWRQSLPRWARDGATFQRGFVERVSADAWEFMRGGARLLARHPVRRVSLHFDIEDRRVLRALAQSRLLLRISALDLSECSLYEGGVGILAESPNLRHLRSLAVRGNEIGSQGARLLADSTNLGRCHTLELDHNLIHDGGVVALAASPGFSPLTRLYLCANNIGDEGVVAIAASPRMTDLEILNISDNDIGDDGAVALATSPPMARLSRLLLAGNRLGNEAARALAASAILAHLVVLDLRGNGIGRSGAEALRQRFGDVVHL